jgi:hypothetical protein
LDDVYSEARVALDLHETGNHFKYTRLSYDVVELGKLQVIHAEDVTDALKVLATTTRTKSDCDVANKLFKEKRIRFKEQLGSQRHGATSKRRKSAKKDGDVAGDDARDEGDHESSSAGPGSGSSTDMDNDDPRDVKDVERYWEVKTEWSDAAVAAPDDDEEGMPIVVQIADNVQHFLHPVSRLRKATISTFRRGSYESFSVYCNAHQCRRVVNIIRAPGQGQLLRWCKEGFDLPNGKPGQAAHLKALDNVLKLK